jgi:hypothetical protein
LHARNPSASALSIANTALAGVLLSLAYLRTRALWLPIGLHLSWNYAQAFLYGLPVSGLEFSAKLLSAQPGEVVWLSGGSYGPEGSVLAMAAATLASVWLGRTRYLGVSPALGKVLE